MATKSLSISQKNKKHFCWDSLIIETFKNGISTGVKLSNTRHPMDLTERVRYSENYCQFKGFDDQRDKMVTFNQVA